MNILVINGPNLNLLGIRETDIYGTTTLAELMIWLETSQKGIKHKFKFYQSNHEGEIIEKIHSVQNGFEGIIINPAAYTHTSIALLDALRATSKPNIEVHISNIYAREDYRRKRLTSEAVNGIICGFGENGYILAIEAMKKLIYSKD